MDATGRTTGGMSFRAVAWFFAITFGLGWGILAILMLFPAGTEAIFGPMGYTNPLFILAVYSPAIAGVLLVGCHHGPAALPRFLSRLTLWRMPGGWWVLLAAGVPAVFYLGAAVKGTLSDPFPFSPWYDVLPAMMVGLLIGPVEEFGWRGVALPLLQRRLTPLAAGAVLGVIWGLWHLPAFFLSGSPQSAWAFGPYFLGVVSISVILTPMFNAARGSILVAALYHFQMNGPAWPDAQPFDSVLFAGLAIAVVIRHRKSMLTRAGAVTSVFRPGEES